MKVQRDLRREAGWTFRWVQGFANKELFSKWKVGASLTLMAYGWRVANASAVSLQCKRGNCAKVRDSSPRALSTLARFQKTKDKTTQEKK